MKAGFGVWLNYRTEAAGVTVEREAVKTNQFLWAVTVIVTACLAASWAWAQEEDEPDSPEQPVDQVAPEGLPAENKQVEQAPPVEPGVPEEQAAQEPQEPVEQVQPAEEEEVAPPPQPMPQRPARPIRPQPVRPRPLLPSRAGEPSEPSAPKVVPAPAANKNAGPKDGQTPESPVTFDFDNVPLNNVINAIARMTGKNFDVDPNIASVPVTVITHDQIPPSLAYQVLESILSSRGFKLVETLDGHLVKVLQAGEKGKEKMPLDTSTSTPSDRYDTWSTHVVGVKNADASELSGILPQLGSDSCSVDAYAPTNTLIITDNADGLRRIFAFLEQVDIPGFDTKMEIFTLEYTRAEVLSTQIEQVLSPESAGRGAQGQPPSPARPTRPVRPSRPTVPGTSAPIVIGSRQEILRIVPDERLNALIAVATESMMERVRDLVGKLDTPTPYEANNLNVYELLNAKAEEVESALNALVGTTPRQAGPGGAGGGAAPAEIQPFEKKVIITKYEQTNALLILASPQDYKLIKEIIAQLDVPTRQVHLEAVVLEVSINDNFTLNVESTAFQKDTHGIVALNNVVNLANVLTKGPLAAAGAGLTAGYMDGTTTITVAGTDGALTPMVIPNVPLLITALENMTDIDVLSQPVLTTKDNEAANIVVGQEVPVPNMRSGYSYSSSQTDRSSTAYSGLTTAGRGISREDVGVKMTVTPHINEGDYITSEIEIEVSQPIVSDVGIDPNELGPTFQKSMIKNNVVIRDGDTAIIGGLISETTDHSLRQIPVIGDVPVLGWLFRSRGAQRRKRNLVILLTPHIIREGGDLERLTDYRMDEFRGANADVLFEKGFIRKIKSRSYMRNKHRPGVERSKQYETGKGFGRGDIAR